MNCHELQNDFVPYLLDELHASRVREIEDHLASPCDACRREMKSLRESVELVYELAPKDGVSEELVESVLTRVRETRSGMSPEDNVAGDHRLPNGLTSAPVEGTNRFKFGSGNRNRRNGWGGYHVVLAVASMAAGVFVAFGLSSAIQLSQQSERTAGVIKSVSPWTVRKPDDRVSLVSVDSASATEDYQGLALMDRVAGELHLFGYGLQSPKSNIKYRVQIRADNRVTTESVVVDGNGRFHLIIKAPVEKVQSVSVIGSDGRGEMAG
jgi:hypothetical protein